MTWLVLILIAVISYLALFKLPQRLRILQKMKVFNGPPSLPLLGNSMDFSKGRRDVLNVFQKFIDTYGYRYKLWLGIQPYVVVANASDVEKILGSQTQIEKSSDYDFIHRWVGLGLLTSGGEKWFRRRKQLTPAFHFKILEDFLRVFNEQCAVLRNVLEKKGSQKIDVFPVITHCALDIICETAMGRRINAQEKSSSEYVKAIYQMSETIQYRELRPWLYPDISWSLSPAGRMETKNLEILHKFTDTVIQERKRERKEMKKGKDPKPKDSKAEDDDIYLNSAKKKEAFLDLLLDAQETDPTLTDKNIREETDTFMFEGHDTTSAAASWTTFLLACYPEMQNKVHDELDSIFGGDRTRDVTTADLAKMKYLECCIKEALRIYPSVPFIGRRLTKDLELDNEAAIPVGCSVFIHIYFLHRDPKVFPDPEKFDPDRFSPENVQGRHPFAYVPFSAGPRNCIGQKFAMMEEKVMVSTIFRNFYVKAAIKREEVNVLCEIITRPEDGLYVTLEKR